MSLRAEPIAKKLGITQILNKYPYEVSGGQKQRLSIARALVRKPDIYIYVRFIFSTGYETDAVLRQALKPEVKNAIVIIVAQRVSTIMDADQILVLDEGHLAASGRHEELLKHARFTMKLQHLS